MSTHTESGRSRLLPRPVAKNNFDQEIYNRNISENTSTLSQAFLPLGGYQSSLSSPAGNMPQTHYGPEFDLDTLPSSISSNPLSLPTSMWLMDPAWLESVAFSLEQFPPESHINFPDLPPDGLTSETSTDLTQCDFPVLEMASSISEEGPSLRSGAIPSFDGLVTSQSRRHTSTTHNSRARNPRVNQKDNALAPSGSPGQISDRPDHPSGLVRSTSPSSQDSDGGRLQEKRHRNKIAARKLRQKRVDQILDLESRLEKMQKERDELRVKAAKWEGEVTILRDLLGRRTGEGLGTY